MSELQIGDLAPNLVLTTLEGKSVSLASYWENNEILLVVFLRHLG